jgi:hypothetical protein
MARMSVSERYLRTDEEVEASDALHMAAALAERVASDLRVWRWLSIALHSAAQGFMVLSLRHGNGLLALTKESTRAWLEAHEKRRTNQAYKYPEERLDTYLGLYKKVKHSKTGAIGGNTPFKPKGSEGRSIRMLNSLRNEFIHFTPKGWSLEVSGMPRISLDVLVLVSFLGWESGNIFWHDEGALERAREAHLRLVHSLRAIDAEYCASA